MAGCLEECVHLFVTTDGTLLKSFSITSGLVEPQGHGSPKIAGRIAQVSIQQIPLVRSVDNSIKRINRYPANKCLQNKPRCLLDEI